MDHFRSRGGPLTVFLNGNTSQRCEVILDERTTCKDIIQECVEHFRLPSVGKYRVFDSQGGEIDNDDIEDLNSDEPLFLSKGEDFKKSSSLALYTEISVLGRGGFGIVKLYQHILTNKKVAIKFVNIRQIESAATLDRIFKEIQTLRSLTHPNIVKLEDSFTLDNYLCFVMEYCKGGELRKHLAQSGPLPEEQVYSISLQLVEAIHYCHSARVIHRDLKLENILFADSGHTHIKIVDFGIAGMLTVGGQGDHSDAGSLLYLAPEVLSRVDTSSTPALDIWSIGCIIYCLLTNVHPFLCEKKRDSIKRILTADVPDLPATVSPPWSLLVKNILRRNPSRRWSLLQIEEFLHKWRGKTDFSDLQSISEEEKSPVEERKKAIAKDGKLEKTDPKLRRRATISIEGMKEARPKAAVGVFERLARSRLAKKGGASQRSV